MKWKRQKVTKVECKRDKSPKQGLFPEYILLKYSSFRRKSKLDHKANLRLELHDYEINYVNIDLRHQYEIAAAAEHPSLL